MITFTGRGAAYGGRMTLTLIVGAVALLGFGLATAKVSPSRSYREPYLP